MTEPNYKEMWGSLRNYLEAEVGHLRHSLKYWSEDFSISAAREFVEDALHAEKVLDKMRWIEGGWRFPQKEGKPKGTPIDDLDLSIRSHNILSRNGVETIEQLTKKTYSSLLLMRNMGKRCANEIQSKLEAKGHHLKEETKND